MGLFRKKTVTKTYDKENKKPVIKASICNGEQVAGFKDIHTGKIEEVMLIKNQADLDAFTTLTRHGNFSRHYGNGKIVPSGGVLGRSAQSAACTRLIFAHG